MAASAQTGVYAEFTAGLENGVASRLYGPTIGLYHDDGFGLIALGLDVRGSFLRSRQGGNVTESLNTVQGGVRLAITPHVLPIKPYGEALVGYASLSTGGGVARLSGGHLGYQGLAGVDLTFLPRIDWRVVEFSYQGFTGLGQEFFPKTLSTGLVLRLP